MKWHRFPWIVGGLLVILLLGYRWGTGAGWGLRPPLSQQGSVATGILFNVGDNLSYSAWSQQAKQGQWRLQNLYTTDKHDAVYVNVYFGVVGRISAWLNVAPFGVMVCLSVLMALFTVVLLYHCALALGFPVIWARWTAVFVAFSSGLSAPWHFFCQLLGIYATSGADVKYLDAFAFSTFFVYPYHAFALACLGLLMWLWIRLETHPVTWRGLALCLGVALVLVWTHPYEPVVFLGSWGGWLVLMSLHAEQRLHQKRRWLGLLAIGVVVGSGIAYNLWVSSLPVWKSFAGASLTLKESAGYWLLGYGMLLPATLLGLVAIRRHSHWPVSLWPGLWTLGMVALLLGGVPQTKICNGGALPMCLMAGAGWGWLWDRIVVITRPELRRGAVVAYGLGTSLFFITSVSLLFYVFRPHHVDASLYRVAAIIRQHHPHGHPVVLSDFGSGATLPGLFGFHVFAGNGGLTPKFMEKRDILAHAGIEVPLAAIPPAFHNKVWLFFLQLIDQTQANFVLLRIQSATASLLRKHPKIMQQWRFQQWILLQVKHGK